MVTACGTARHAGRCIQYYHHRCGHRYGQRQELAQHAVVQRQCPLSDVPAAMVVDALRAVVGVGGQRGGVDVKR